MPESSKKSTDDVLVDDDPTAELRALSLPDAAADDADGELEADARTYDFSDDDPVPATAELAELRSDLKSRSRRIGKLQFDLEQLRAKWLGLETEIRERDDISRDLQQRLDTTSETLDRKSRLLAKRDKLIKSMKREIRQRDAAYRELEERLTTLSAERDTAPHNLAAMQEQLERLQASIEAGRKQILEAEQIASRREAYADGLRQQLQRRIEADSARDREIAALTSEVREAQLNGERLASELAGITAERDRLQTDLDSIEKRHEEEIRKLRFELGEAQETVSQHELISEQLAADLVDTRNFRDELQSTLRDREESLQAEIDSLRRELGRLAETNSDYEDRLATKSEAINCLLAELASKSEQIESIGELEDVIHDIDDRMSEQLEARHGSERDRVTCMLVGKIGRQELRFPLFKHRLTIGRTGDNDIQLKAPYISRRHAVVMTEASQTRVIDWGSKNGVFVNGNRITEHFLQQGDVVTIGNADFRYEEKPRRDTKQPAGS